MAEVYHIPAQPAPVDFPILVNKAVTALNRGKIVAMPSDTIYGLFSAYGEFQIEKLHEIKNRPLDKPFLLVFPESYPLDEFINESTMNREMTDKIADLWPGRNTLVLPKNPRLKYPAGDSIAIRKPSKDDNPFFYDVLNRYNKPLLAPSLNIHGDQPLIDLFQIEYIFGDKVDSIFFDDTFKPGQPSQIWDLTKKPYVRLR